MEERLHVISHPMLEHKLAQLRNKNTNTMDFRSIVEEMTAILTYEATKDLPLREIEVETPMCVTTAREIEGKTLAAVVILRSGIGMVPGVTEIVPSAKIGHIGIYHEQETGDIVQYYCKMPTDISNREVLLLEPIIATGKSSSLAINTLKTYACKNIKLISILATKQGIAEIFKNHPDVEIYCCNTDDTLDENGFLVPGIGDAGNRIFGTN